MTIIESMKRYVSLLMLCILFTSLSAYARADSHATTAKSKRIEVYAISQSFWDVTPGDTLGDIVKQLLPNNPSMRNTLLHEIVRLNPGAFSKSNPDNLKANVRLWLPNNSPAMRSTTDKNKYDIKSFSWGQVYRPKRD